MHKISAKHRRGCGFRLIVAIAVWVLPGEPLKPLARRVSAALSLPACTENQPAHGHYTPDCS
jgi:hypothetical protein